MPRTYQQMNNQDLIDFLKQGGALVDIRRQEEWQSTGIVQGSHLLTFFAADGSSQPQEWLAQLDQLVPAEQPLALICRTGYRTGLICDFLVEVSNREKISHLSHGVLGWLAEQLPVVKVGMES